MISSFFRDAIGAFRQTGCALLRHLAGFVLVQQCCTTSPASQSQLARRQRSCRAGIEAKARVSSLKPAVL